MTLMCCNGGNGGDGDDFKHQKALPYVCAGPPCRIGVILQLEKKITA